MHTGTAYAVVASTQLQRKPTFEDEVFLTAALISVRCSSRRIHWASVGGELRSGASRPSLSEVVGVGSGEAFLDAAERSAGDELTQPLREVFGFRISRQLVSPIRQAARQLFAGKHGASIGFMAANARIVLGSNNSHAPVRLISGTARELHIPARRVEHRLSRAYRWPIGDGTKIELEIPDAAIAQFSNDDRLVARDLVYGPADGGLECMWQCGGGPCPPDQISEVESGALYPGMLDTTHASSNAAEIAQPYFVLGRIVNGPIPTVELVLFGFNQNQRDGVLGGLGVHLAPAIVHTGLRPEIYGQIDEWLNLGLFNRPRKIPMPPDSRTSELAGVHERLAAPPIAVISESKPQRFIAGANENLQLLREVCDDRPMVHTRVRKLSIATLKPFVPRNAGATADRERDTSVDGSDVGGELLQEAELIGGELDAIQVATVRRLLRLIRGLGSASVLPSEQQASLVRTVCRDLTRVHMHVVCATCGAPSVPEYERPRGRNLGGIVLAHVSKKRGKHTPSSWQTVVLVKRGALGDCQALQSRERSPNDQSLCEPAIA